MVVLGLIIAGSVSAAAALVFMPVGRPRIAETEGMNGKKTVSSYDRVRHWPLFLWIRHKVMKKVRCFNLGGSLIDIGCGPGHLAIVIGKKYPVLTLTCVDVSPATTETACRNLGESTRVNVRFVTGDTHHLPFDDAEVDFVLSTLSLHHWRDASRALREIHRVLKTGGQFFAPRAHRKENGALSYLRASYTPRELARGRK